MTGSKYYKYNVFRKVNIICVTLSSNMLCRICEVHVSEGETNANPNPKMTTEHVAGYAQRRRRRRRDCLAILQRHHILKSERRGDWEGRGDLDVRSPLASWHHLNLYIPSIYLSVQVENFINVGSKKISL